MNTKTIRLDWLADPRAEGRLLPGAMRQRDNSRRLRHCKKAIGWAMKRLKPEQRERLQLFYTGGLSQSEIARRQQVGKSCVSKSLRSGEGELREYAALYMEIYDNLERELLQDDEY
jgi:DNA-directed RNA polymerase specialized sigma24 family protein